MQVGPDLLPDKLSFVMNTIDSNDNPGFVSGIAYWNARLGKVFDNYSFDKDGSSVSQVAELTDFLQVSLPRLAMITEQIQFHERVSYILAESIILKIVD